MLAAALNCTSGGLPDAGTGVAVWPGDAMTVVGVGLGVRVGVAVAVGVAVGEVQIWSKVTAGGGTPPEPRLPLPHVHPTKAPFFTC